MPDFERLTARISKYLERTGVPALALGVVQGHELTYARGFGRIAHGNSQQSVSPDTLFPSCSTAKPITATAILQLVERGILKLDSPVVQYLPWLKYPEGGDASQVTTRHLLTHTSGLSSDPDFPDRFFSGRPECLEDHVRHDVPGYKAAGRPGEVFWYSNPAFNIAGYLAERLTGMRFAELIEEMVLSPASMDSTSFDPAFRTDRLAVDVPDSRRPPVPYPAGGAVTTIRDLSKFAISHMHGGSLPHGELLGRPTVQMMHGIHADAYARSPRWYGLGVDIEFHRGRKLVTHGGGGFGCGSTFVMVPEEKVAVMVLFNHPAGHGVQARDILDEVLGHGDTPDKEPSRPDSDLWPTYTGVYRSVWLDVEGCPNEITITGSTESLHMIVSGELFQLKNYNDPVYQTEDGKASVGFVPGGKYLMYDGFGIGLVSALPYKRAAQPADAADAAAPRR